MANATCNNCGKKVHWGAHRGCKLEEVRCPECGGTCHAENFGKTGSNLGRRMETCVVCGSRKYLFLRPQEDYIVMHFAAKGSENNTFPAGSPCCDNHDPHPAGFDPRAMDNLQFRSVEWCELHNRLAAFRKAAGTRHPWLVDPMTPILKPEDCLDMSRPEGGTMDLATMLCRNVKRPEGSEVCGEIRKGDLCPRGFK